MISLKESIKRVLLFLFDFTLICLCSLSFAYHISMLLARHLSFLPIPYWDYPPQGFLGFIVVILVIYRGLHAWLRRQNTQAARHSERLFFVVLTVIGAVSSYLTSRLIFMHASFPKGFGLIVVLVGLALAWLLPRRLFWRKAPLLFAIIIFFNFRMILVSRMNVSISDLVPPESAGVKVATSLPNVLKSGPRARGFMSFTGILLPVYQYRYVALDARQDFLFASDFTYFGNQGRICRVRLDDHEVVSCLRKNCYLERILHHENADLLVSTLWSASQEGKLFFFDPADLNEIVSVDLPFKKVMNLAELPEGRLLVTSEEGWIVVLDADRNVMQKIRLPTFPQGICLDKKKGIAAIGSAWGDLITLSTRDLQILKRRKASFYSGGVAIDPAGGRIFLVRAYLGDILVCDEDTLETVGRIPLEPGVRIVCYIQEKRIIVAGNYFNGKLYFVDGEDYRILHTVWVGTKIRSMQYAPLRERLYVSTALRILEVDLNALGFPG